MYMLAVCAATKTNPVQKVWLNVRKLSYEKNMLLRLQICSGSWSVNAPVGSCSKVEGTNGMVVGFKKMTCSDNNMVARLYSDDTCTEPLRYRPNPI